MALQRRGIVTASTMTFVLGMLSLPVQRENVDSPTPVSETQDVGSLLSDESCPLRTREYSSTEASPTAGHRNAVPAGVGMRMPSK